MKVSADSAGVAKKAQPAAPKVEKAIPVDESDPIDLAFHQRKSEGSIDTVIKEAEAKKKNIQIP